MENKNEAIIERTNSGDAYLWEAMEAVNSLTLVERVELLSILKENQNWN